MLTACDKASESSVLGSVIKEQTASDVAKEVVDSVINYDYDTAISLSTDKPLELESRTWDDAIPSFEMGKEHKAKMESRGIKMISKTNGQPYTLSIAEEELIPGTKIINGVKQPDVTLIIVKADAGEAGTAYFRARLSNADGKWRVFDFKSLSRKPRPR